MSDQYEKDIELAAEAERFRTSRLARYIFDRAAEVVDGCKAALTHVDPEDVKEIRKLQEEIRRQNGLAVWLTEIINIGHQAKQQSAEEEN